MLFQTGYLTVKSIDAMTGNMVLDYPNKEVRESMYQFAIDDLAKNPYRTHTGHTIEDLNQAFLTKDLPKVKKILNALLADLPNETFERQREGLYHGLIHLIFSYLGMFVNSEVHSSQGRADAVVQTLTDIFIFEFKFKRLTIGFHGHLLFPIKSLKVAKSRFKNRVIANFIVQICYNSI